MQAAFIDALVTIDIALAYHPHKDPSGVIRKTARKLVHRQEAHYQEYLQLLIKSHDAQAALKQLHTRLEKLWTQT